MMDRWKGMNEEVCTNLEFRLDALITDCCLHALITDCCLHVLITAGCRCLAGTKEHAQHLGQEARI